MSAQLGFASLSGEPRVQCIQGTSDPRLRELLGGDTRRSALVTGDSRHVLEAMPDNVFQMCITSPPYWLLRNYNIHSQI